MAAATYSAVAPAGICCGPRRRSNKSMTSRAKGINGPNKQVNSSGMIPKPPARVATIATDSQLVDFAARMQHEPWLAVDTEFQRERSYYPELCLVQIAGREETGLLDVLALTDLKPLARLLSESDVQKVFHAAGQDLEVLQQTLHVVPTPLFDTQIAAALLGLDGQISYARLIDEVTGVKLAKDYTRTDWSRRPLPPQALAYAADDVRHLSVAYPLLRERLQKLGRLSWAKADSMALLAPERLAMAPASAWQRVRGWRELEPAQQQVLAELAQWREHEAMRANRPRKWIVADDALLALARMQPETKSALAASRSLPTKVAQRHADPLLEAIARGRAQPAAPLA